MSHKVVMGSLMSVVISGLMLGLFLCAPVAAGSKSWTPTIPTEASSAMGYLNLMSYEGIPTLGDAKFTSGPPPPIMDWVSTHCRFIDISSAFLQAYFLRYPLHLPDGATISYIQVRVADFAPTGMLWVYLRSRPWNSRASGDTEAFVISSNDSQSDQVLNLMNLNLEVDNTTRSYWLDIAPAAADIPGELCVYGIHVVYIPGIFADGFESGDTTAWSSTVQ